MFPTSLASIVKVSVQPEFHTMSGVSHWRPEAYEAEQGANPPQRQWYASVPQWRTTLETPGFCHTALEIYRLGIQGVGAEG